MIAAPWSELATTPGRRRATSSPVRSRRCDRESRASGSSSRTPQSYRRPAAWSALLYGVTNVAIVTLCSALGLTELGDALLAAALAWAAIPIPMLASDTLFLKLDPLLLVPHGLGWLVRLLLTAAVAAWFL